MGIKTVKPTSAGRRGMSFLTFEEISRSKPEKSLLRRNKRHGGRNNTGKVTVRHQGGGHKKAFRLIDFKRNKDGIPAKVASIEYDPNRSARIALLHYADGEKRYILAPDGLTVGMTVMSGPEAEIRLGNCLPLRNVPVGSTIHNIELARGRGGQIVRSAGTSAQLVAKEGEHALVRLPSGEVRRIPVDCRSTLGQVSNIDHKNISLGKAGRKRHRGIKPTVRGVVMNACDHPHGGGEGKSPIGGKPQTPWGRPAMGYKTRRKNKINPLIVTRRGKR